MRQTLGSKILLVVGLAGVSGQLFALPLLPGGTVLSPASATAPTGPAIFVDPISGQFGTQNPGYNANVGPGSRNNAEGQYVSAVFLDPVTHRLDFYYQIQNNFTGGVNLRNTLASTFNITDFSGFAITDVRQLSGANANFDTFFKTNTTNSIKSVSRSLDGSTVTVNLAKTLAPKNSSTVLLLMTNATNFGQGTSGFSFVNAPTGCSAANIAAGKCGNSYTQPFQLSALEPIATPEPGFYGLLSVGVGGLLFAVRRRKATPTV